MNENDEFDFGLPPEIDHEKEKLKSSISDLHVLIDTLQTNLRSAVAELSKHDIDTSVITNVQSYKWCVAWRPENE